MSDHCAFTVNEFCARNKVSRFTFYKEVKSGRLKVVKVGARTIVPAANAQAWLANLPIKGAADAA